MTKPVPDPPLTTTTSTTFGSCNGSHDPLFSVRADITFEDALVHTSVLLKSAYQTTELACDRVDEEVRRLLWSTERLIEMALALVEALLDEVEARSMAAAQLRRTMQAGQPTTD
ncbi:DUF3077 domain-containing protein [Pseudomonas sp. P66]|jgi:hypothetical protein|uniref:DUF3077 domain-containing protein n=1 Tax=Pseudomonas arcuscaelestis TaxID=2710591 RepID=A0ABS2C1V4_9PSED|nr:DUF3077 domain-containing protein [Pseudomonas arcuscaelestis]MBM3103577.1 DUF3077 domain-containing protein [Pseudomonas arcuscaelestis]MBM3110462.1 DUF3077 domain-containing protein [Pseudomonas arcuscaelestis]MBM5459700.1 DUF3077 domain-containing protein [Pseudomonas arcuscaelestis]